MSQESNPANADRSSTSVPAQPDLEASAWHRGGILDTVFSAALHGFLIWKPVVSTDGKVTDFRLVTLNPAAERILGITHDQAAGQNILTIAPWTRSNGAFDAMLTCLQEKRPLAIEVIRKTDQILELSLSPVPGPAVLVAMQDVTADRARSAVLAEREAQLRLFVEHAPAAVAMFDTEMRYIAHSRRWTQDYRLSRRDLRGLSHYEVFPDIPWRWRCLHERCLAGESLSAEEDRWERADGSIDWVRWEILPWRRATGEIGGAMMFTESIAERKQAADHLRNALAAADAASRAKSQFLAHMSHEFRTPLTAILGSADALTQPHATPEEARAHAQTISRSGNRLLTLLNDTLDLSKLEAGQMAVTCRAVHVAQTIHEVLATLAPQAAANQIHFELHARGTIPASIHTDPERLRQILANLAGNAVKFTRRGTVRIAVSSAVAQDGSPLLRFDVTDTGEGVSQAARTRLFEPFVQGDHSMARRYGGLGLGLVICRGLARRLGGDAWLESTEPGAGSTFSATVAAPAADGRCITDLSLTPSQDEPSPDARAGGHGGRVLLAEDNPDSQRLLTHMLRRAGLEVTIASDGLAAVELATRAASDDEGFDLILMDMQMPELDGCAATRAIREAGVAVPIIALTAHAMSDDREACLAAGCDDYATKPIDRPALTDLCRRWLNRAA